MTDHTQSGPEATDQATERYPAAIAWVESEVAESIAACIASRDAEAG